MRSEVLLAAEAQRLGGWITYLIRDPRFPDLRGNTAGTPIYIGQTKQFPVRVMRRFMTCERKATIKDSVSRRVADLLHADVVVRYEVLERTPTHLSSLVSETNWVKRCRNAGYDLCNEWAEQRVGGALIDRHGVPSSRLHQFRIADAITDDVEVQVRCKSCRFFFCVDLDRILASPNPPITLGGVIRTVSGMGCTSCGTGVWKAKAVAR